MEQNMQWVPFLLFRRLNEANLGIALQLAHLKIVSMYKNGASQTDRIAKYKALLMCLKNAF
jgi:hypothetical protein